MATHSRHRIALGALFSETSHFLTTTVGLDHWRNTYVLTGDEIRTLRGATCEEAGALHVLEHAGVEIVPLLAARAVSSGPTRSDAYHLLRHGILAPLRAAGPVDGVFLAMHGSLTAVDELDPEGDILAAVRAIVGPSVPVVSTLDLHGHVTLRMIENADALVAFTRYPHDDTFTTGERGARLLLGLVAGKVRPAMAIAKVPVLCSGIRGMTFGEAPMTHLTARARAIEKQPGVLSASVFQVHATNDLPGMGSGGLVVTDGDFDQAVREATGIAEELWQRRHEFEPEIVSIEEGVRHGLAIKGGPVLLVDTADCVGGGAAGDSVALLRRLIELKVDALTYLTVVDPEAASACATAGIGANVKLEVGYKIDPSWGEPLVVEGTVLHLLNGEFTFSGGAFGGTTGRMGLSAVLAIGSIRLFIMSRPTYDWADEQLRAAGLDPHLPKFIGVKNPMNYNFAYRDIAKGSLVLDTPGPTPATSRNLPYKRMRRPFFPIDDEIPGLRPTVFARRSGGAA
jgi:microcystin degradation protein MlrC